MHVPQVDTPEPINGVVFFLFTLKCELKVASHQFEDVRLKGVQQHERTVRAAGPTVGTYRALRGGVTVRASTTTTVAMENRQSQVLNLERVQALETWLKATNTQLIQVNGQRKYGGPPEVWDGPTPGTRSEVFISQIPRDAYEDLLIPLFSSVGPLWEFRLMMNFSGQNRGFAYAKYGSAAVANHAIQLLHGHMLEPGVRLCVRRSTEKRHLCIGDLPSTTKQEHLLQVLRVLAEGVERVSLKAGPGIEGVSAIVAFSSHHTASMAKKMLMEAFKKQFALNVSVKWQSTVKPRPDETIPTQKPPKSLQPFPLKPPRLIPNSPQSSVLPPPLSRPASTPPGFCRAVGRPTAPKHPYPPCSSNSSSCQGHKVSAASPVMLLGKVCEAIGFGQPVYEIYYSHTGPDGFIYFTYRVNIPGVTIPFKGLVMVLLGPSTTTIMEEAQQSAAHQVLQRVYNNQLDH
ncbi:Dead end protein 1 [Channa argus]|uniref:Dead end protein 1 n=2 Tax=Channa argus TaxID=215402 RepID=A0A6G1PU47_CHAAH|nr:Dead end protein 1 [Channa argus]